MKQSLLITIATLLISLSSFGQTDNLEDINNRLFLNAYVYPKTDSLTLLFLKNNFPYLAKEKPTGGLVRPPISADAKQTTTSYKFKRHPFFDFKITEGQLDFTTVEESKESKFETGAQLWLLFNNEGDANKAYDELVELYSKVSTTKDISEDNGQKVAKFIGSGSNNSTRKSHLTLIKVDNANYKINFKNWFRSN